MEGMKRISKSNRSNSPKRRAGRPPAGLDGQAVSTLPRITIRVPDEFRQRLNAIAADKDLPQWRILMDALDAYERTGRRNRRPSR